MATSPTSVRIPEPIVSTIRAQARRQRRSFSNQLIVLLERALDDAPAAEDDGLDPAEVERYADLAREMLREHHGYSS